MHFYEVKAMSNIWYTYKPVDTILVRGADDDASSAFSIFPPPASTIIGALRTAYLFQQGIDFVDYKNNKADQSIYNAIGKASEQASFAVLGPLFLKDMQIYAPCPAGWFYQSEKENTDDNIINIIELQKDNIIPLRSFSQKQYNSIYSSKPIKAWPKKYCDKMKPMGDKYISLDDLLNFKNKENITLYTHNYFFTKEPRVGVALYDNRNTREGKLYSFSHYRLVSNTALLFAITQDIGLGSEGMMKLGAEQRFGKYTKFTNTILEQLEQNEINNTAYYHMSLSYNQCTDIQNSILAFERIVYFGGWDLAKGFHKPMTAHYPPGSLFSQKLTNTIGLSL